MSSASRTRDGIAAGSQLPASPVAALSTACRAAGFWLAIVVPFVVAGLLAAGLVGQHPGAVGGLLGLNVAGLLVGRNYEPRARRRR